MDMTENGAETQGTVRPIYFLQSDFCGAREQTHTLRGWLEQFGIPVEDEFYVLWTEKVTALSKLFNKLEEKKVPADAMGLLWNLSAEGIYVHYDTEKDFIPQFQENTEKLMEILIGFEGSYPNAVYHDQAAAVISSNQL